MWFQMGSTNENHDDYILICKHLRLLIVLQLVSMVTTKGKVSYGQEPPSGESTN